MLDFVHSMPIRERRAIERVRSGLRVAEGATRDSFVVPSESGRSLHNVRLVEPPGPVETCDCEDFEARQAPCFHIYVVRHWLSGDLDLPRITKRDWRAYDQSQTQEYAIFRRLLLDLAKGFPEPFKDPLRAGRKPIPLMEQAYWAVQRSYLGFSLRRSHDFRVQSVKQGLLDDPHYYALTSHFLCRSDVREGLHDMLARSALPLVAVEDRCAIDSTGLRTTRFNYYRKEKYEPSRENDWRKLHALVGVKTHVIPVLEVTAGSANDSPQFPILLKRAHDCGFSFKEVYADKAYQGRQNFNMADELDVLPFIPFKRNQTGESKGSPLYHKMFWYAKLHREEFDLHYGQRAQVESTFGSIKQKFSETLSSKKFDSQYNEVLCVAIAHNITVLVRQMFEVNLLPEFLQPTTT